MRIQPHTDVKPPLLSLFAFTTLGVFALLNVVELGADVFLAVIAAVAP